MLNNENKVENIAEWIKRREEIKKILCDEEYGNFPKEHVPIKTELIKEDINYCGGTAIFQEILLTMHLEQCDFSFPVRIATPKKNKSCPAFVYIDFFQEFPNKYLPVEEICDNGFAVISFCYQEVTSDDNDFTNGLSNYFFDHKETRDFGKILIWS